MRLLHYLLLKEDHVHGLYNVIIEQNWKVKPFLYILIHELSVISIKSYSISSYLITMILCYLT